MAKPEKWAFPKELQPRADQTQFNLLRALDAAVLVRAEIPEDGFTADALGTERGGYGVVIRADGLVLTIGYLITEATQIWLTSNRGSVVQGYPLAYDQATGFGLIQPLGKLDAPHLELGLASDVKVGDSAFVIGHGGRAHALKTRLVAKQEFAGYWEYLLDEAMFTAPAHPQWGGAGLLDAHGDLIGIGSLLIERLIDGKSQHANMFVPVDLLRPIMDAMLKTGSSQHPARPWLGLFAQERDGNLVIGNLATGGPADLAGAQVGDLVIGVGVGREQSLAGLYRAVWGLGPAGVEVPLTLGRGGSVVHLAVKSGDRNDYLKKPNLQ